MHPGPVTVAPALAVAEEFGGSGRDVLTAVIAGYELGMWTFINTVDPIDAAKLLSAASSPDTRDAAALSVRRGA